MQEFMETEEQAPLILIVTRAERGRLDGRMESLQTGRSKLPAKDIPLSTSDGSTLRDQLDLHSPGLIQTHRAALLRYMNCAVEAAKLPTVEQRARLQELEATAISDPVLVRLFVPALYTVNESCLRTQAQLRCASAAMAVERYRQAKGRWPQAWDEVIAAGLLHDTPIDVYDGKSLRLRRVDDGMVIYSVRPDGVDNGGQVIREALARLPADIGFRLWDVDNRRQPSAPLKPAFHEEPLQLP
jgi:hypothetical protein